MPASSSMIVSCAVALSFAAAVSAGAQVDAQGSASLHRVLRRQSHGIELAADQLVARSTSEKRKTDTPVAAENKEERQVVECGHGLQIALSANTAVDDVVRACQNKVKRTYDSRIKAKRLAKPEEEDAVEEQKRWVLTDWIAEDDKQDSSFDSDIQINDEAEDEEESASSKKPSNQSVKLAADDEDSETQDEAEVDIPEEEDYEEESYAPYREAVYGYIIETVEETEDDSTTTSARSVAGKASATTAKSVAHSESATSTSTMTAPSSSAHAHRKQIDIESSSSSSAKSAATSSTSSRGAVFEVVDLHDASVETRDPTDTLTRRALPADASPVVKPTAPVAAPVVSPVDKEGKKANDDDDDEDFDVLDKIGSLFGLNRANDPSKSSRIAATAAAVPTEAVAANLSRRWGERSHGDARSHAHDAAKRWAEDLAKSRARRDSTYGPQGKMALIVKRQNVYDRYASSGRRVKRAE